MTHTSFRYAAAQTLLSTSGLQAASPVAARPCLTPVGLRAVMADKMPLAMSAMSVCVV